MKRIALLFICTLICSSIFAQVPVIPEPSEFKFENYSSNQFFNTKTPSTPSIQLPTVPAYTQQANSQVYNPSAWMINKYYVKPNMTPEEQVRYADEQIRQHELEQRRNDVVMNEANSIFDALRIDYELPFKELPEKQIYAAAFIELERMLKGELPIDLEKAVYVVEHAFDPTLNFGEFDRQLNKAANVIGLKMQQDKISLSDNIGKVMTTFKYFADTISVASKGETTITSYPKEYDFEDFWGKQDYRKMFVSKLLKEGSGQCHSMPLLFLLLCEKIGAKANLAFAPNHSFIKFQDKYNQWHNIELTNGMLASDHFMVESGFVKAEAIQNKIYMEPLTKKEVVVQCLNDLALGYQKKYGYDPFVRECANVALAHDSNSLTARQALANYYITLSNYIAYQYKMKGLTRNQFDQDQEAQAIVDATNKAIQEIENLGYADMPEDAYSAWLNSMKDEVNKRQHSNEVKVLGGMIER
ncbi:MAG TPA: hypothetical protein PKL56_18240 [Cyclobacteriaceae bacterium]|nr:hypothetical protein [Cyclobacteriaceae bacterium]HMX00946.1 hypothetical protein [Cyclobacteriaceae bacterium]HMX50011.1 hypothetical protein [Cyclobacteriaceae bacterium]HMY93750.1 hypothetical protein [Cyclobacteriaceae bacterium]HNA12595.1 hypothetical protein [Cyclobacteriaceae bacterium]